MSRFLRDARARRRRGDVSVKAAALPAQEGEVWRSDTHTGTVVDLDEHAREITIEWVPTTAWEAIADAAQQGERALERATATAERQKLRTRHVGTWPPVDPQGKPAVLITPAPTSEDVETFFLDTEDV